MYQSIQNLVHAYLEINKFCEEKSDRESQTVFTVFPLSLGSWSFVFWLPYLLSDDFEKVALCI